MHVVVKPLCTAALFTVLVVAHAVPVAADPIDDGRLMVYVAQLEDPSYLQREEATQALLDLDLDRTRLYALLEREGLTAEQRQRLIAVFREQLVKIPRGAVGIRMNWSLRAPGGPGEVEITELVEGLPAERVLELGDRISHVDGRPLLTQNDLVTRVQRKLPGEHVMLTVHRPRLDEDGKQIIDEGGRPAYEVIEAKLELGSAELLINPDTGLPERGGPVEADREREARTIAAEYGLQPRPIVIRGLHPELLTDDLDTLVELHAAIRMIRTERRLIQERRLEVTSSIKARWAHQLALLQGQLADEGLEPHERMYLEKVVDLYARLADDGK